MPRLGEWMPEPASRPVDTPFLAGQTRRVTLSPRTRTPPMLQSARRRTLAVVGVAFSLSLPSELAGQPQIPTPESVFGFPIGAEQRLVDYAQSIDYFRRLAAVSDRIRLIDVGTTSFGRTWTVAII